ncbi:MAG: hypothetical protein HY062_16145 [Bacteroidetes bacterium]|nr:hypothetical protein [Bacteroidota bacterium]
MDDKATFIEPLLLKAEAYGKTSYELIKLKTIDKTSDVLSTGVSRGIAILAFSVFLVMVNIAIALWLGDILGKSYYGFFCVAGFYAVCGLILYFFMHNWIKERISNSIISQLLN